MHSARTAVESLRMRWETLPGMEIIRWDLGAPADPELVEMAFGMPRLRRCPELEQLYCVMNGCTLIWNYSSDGVRRNGHLRIFPVEEMVDLNFMEEFGYDPDDIPGVGRMGKSAYVLSQGDTDTCIDFRQSPPTILMLAQRGDIQTIPLRIADWLDITLLTAGDQSFWMSYLWVQKAGRHKVQNLDIDGWQTLFPEVEEALLRTR